MSFVENPNRKLDWWGPTSPYVETQYNKPTCPTSFTFDSTEITFDNGSCPLFDLGDYSLFSFDSTYINFSGTTPRFDEG